ncbi:MAG: fimbrial assembly protein [Nitrosomonas sp.]|nr:fimbrial assembly protein [Nitrosomonas sp.]MDP1950855.1 fimbrial assembly protein [Nitrosomonas sp.]
MRRLNLRFPYSGQQSQAIDTTLLVLGLLTLVGILYQFTSSMEKVDYWETRVARIEKQQHNVSPRRPSTSNQRGVSQEIRQEIKKASEVIGQINLPWEALFDAVEFAANEEVALLSLQPNVANRTIRIGGEAKDLSALLDFVEALERELIFENAHLVNYKIKLDNPQRPIVFLVTAEWVQTF